MSNVREYLDLQLPYMKRLMKNMFELRAALEDFDENNLSLGEIAKMFGLIEIGLKITQDAHGLVVLYGDFVSGQQEKFELLGYWNSDMEKGIDAETMFELEEHKPRTIGMGTN